MMCDAKSGWNFEVYVGKEYDLRDHITNMGLMDSTTGSVMHVSINCLFNEVCMRYRLASGAVLKLARSLYGKGHIIYTGSVMHVSLNCLFNEVCMRYRLASGAVLKLAQSLYGNGLHLHRSILHLSPSASDATPSGAVWMWNCYV